VVVSRRTSRRRSVLVLLVLTAVTLITLDQRDAGGGFIASARDSARDTIAPVQTAVDDTFRPIGEWWSGVSDGAGLKSENARLRKKLADARSRARAAVPALRENEELKRLTQLPFTAGIPAVATQIISASPGNFGVSVELNKGTDEGIVVGNPVVAGEGLVGRITNASKKRSTVMLLTDPASEVGVRLATSGAPGVAKGRAGSDLLTLDFVAPDVNVTPGELVTTAGLQNAEFPAGLPVATVVSVEKTPGDLSQKVTLRPLVNVGRLEFLDVLIWSAVAAVPPAAPAPAG
jgi:rod shape-determining protein MreC